MFSIEAAAQKLPRRVFLGIRMENMTEDSRRVMELDTVHGVLVREVIPNSTAEAAGIKKGDVLLSINGASAASTNEVFSILAAQQGGSPFRYAVLRDHKVVENEAVFRTLPEERYAGLDVVYTETESVTGQGRIIITKPAGNKRLPVVAFIGGIGCYSLDFPTDSTAPEVQFLNKLARAGFLTARLEKPGQGDNLRHSKSCEEVSFLEETAAYVAAVNTLRKRADVDSNAIYLFGHSMGGVFAPLVAQQTEVKGIIAYGTIGCSFQEYLAKTRRTIAEAYAMSPEETDELIRDCCACSGYYFVDKMSTEEAAAKNPRCREHLPVFDLRSRAYNDELYSFNIPGLWKGFRGKALMLWGESDFIAAREDHEIVAAAINYYHPGNATFRTVKQAAHGMTTAADFAAARSGDGPYNPQVGQAVLDWLKKQS